MSSPKAEIRGLGLGDLPVVPSGSHRERRAERAGLSGPAERRGSFHDRRTHPESALVPLVRMPVSMMQIRPVRMVVFERFVLMPVRRIVAVRGVGMVVGVMPIAMGMIMTMGDRPVAVAVPMLLAEDDHQRGDREQGGPHLGYGQRFAKQRHGQEQAEKGRR